MYVQGHQGDYSQIHEKHLEQLLPEQESIQTHLSESFVRGVQRNSACLPQAVSLCPLSQYHGDTDWSLPGLCS